MDDLIRRIAATGVSAQTLFATSKELYTVIKTIQKDMVKLQKVLGKRPRKAPPAAAASSAAGDATGGAPRKPSGFAKPTNVSKELCDFLGVPPDRMLARTEVTRMLNKYIKDNNLQDPDDRRTIRPDSKLQELLRIDSDTQLKYFNMQSYIKHHFVKADDPPAQ